jgi:hypothetical protein
MTKYSGGFKMKRFSGLNHKEKSKYAIFLRYTKKETH